jgi:hypothetical protein
MLLLRTSGLTHLFVVLVFALLAVPAVGGSTNVARGSISAARVTTYGYDTPSAPTTLPSKPRTVALAARPLSAGTPWSSTSASPDFLAAKATDALFDRAVGAAERAISGAPKDAANDPAGAGHSTL